MNHRDIDIIRIALDIAAIMFLSLCCLCVVGFIVIIANI